MHHVSLPLITLATAMAMAATAAAQAPAPAAAAPAAAAPPASTASAAPSGHEQLRQEVAAVERAFARTMADRDLAAFTRYLAPDTVWKGSTGPLLGPDAVVAVWKKYFDGPTPPFAWAPDEIEVTADGRLAISTGPVRDPAGQVFARFHSVWRQESPGVWRIVLDMGTPHCDCPRR